MPNNLDFKSTYFDGIYNPYGSYSSVNHNAVIEELGYDHRFDVNHEIEDEHNQTQIDESSKEYGFNVISQQDFADFDFSQTAANLDSNSPDSSNQSNSEYNSETGSSVFSLYYHNLDETKDLFEVEKIEELQQNSEDVQSDGISKLEELKKQAQKVRTIQF